MMHDLPLPSGGEYHSRWGKLLLPQLYAWAGSIEDPFCANGQMGNVLENLWVHVFPNLASLEEADKQVVFKVVRALSSILIVLDNNIFCLGQKCTP
jgi:hypothetical protein